MPTEQNFTQCKLHHPNEDGSKLEDVAWIPTQYTKKLNHIRLKNADGEWEGGWVVSEVYKTKTESWLKAHERDYLNQRGQSDV